MPPKDQLQELIDKKVNTIQEIENDIPSMLIVHDIRDWSVVYMSRRGREWLNVTMKELRRMGKDYHSVFFNPEDSKDYAPKIFGLLENGNDEELVTYFQQVRQSPDHDWSWFMSSTKMLLRDSSGAPLLTLTSAIPVDAQHLMAAKAQRLLEENNFLRRNNALFQQLTKTERKVLSLIALGMNAAEIGEKLFISETTAATHRRNIKAKLKAKTDYELIKYAQAFDLV